MNYRFSKAYPDSLLLFPADVLEKLPDAGEGEIRILFYVSQLLSQGKQEEEEICNALSSLFSAEEVRLALSFWRGCGILKSDGKKREPSSVPAAKPKQHAAELVDADEAPFSSAKELADAAESVPDFKNLVSFAEGRLEKVLNTSELARLYTFLDYLKMPVDVIMLVIEDCCSREKKSLRYITKMLTSFQDEGIDSYEKAEAYFVSRKESAVYEKYVRFLFGLGDRKLTRQETEILEIWRCQFGFGEEMLEAAFEKTVASAKNPSIKYMHKILESWHSAGASTPEDIKTLSANSAAKAPKSYDLDDFFQQAVSKGRKNL